MPILLPQSQFRAAPRWFMQVVAGQSYRTLLHPVCHPLCSLPLPTPNSADRPTATTGAQLSFSFSAHDKPKQQRPSLLLPAVGRLSKAVPGPNASRVATFGGPETWQMGYSPRPRAGKMEQHSSPSPLAGLSSPSCRVIHMGIEPLDGYDWPRVLSRMSRPTDRVRAQPAPLFALIRPGFNVYYVCCLSYLSVSRSWRVILFLVMRPAGKRAWDKVARRGKGERKEVISLSA